MSWAACLSDFNLIDKLYTLLYNKMYKENVSMQEDTITREDTTMRKNIYSISEIREAITRLPEQFEQEDMDVVTVTRHGKPVMTILPASAYETLVETIDSLLETLEVMQDEELMASFRRGVQDAAEGRVIPWEEVKKEMGWE